MAYEYKPRQIQRYDYQVQATIYYDMARNEAHNALIWRGRYEALKARVNP